MAAHSYLRYMTLTYCGPFLLATHHAHQVRLSVDVARLASLGVKGAAAGGEPRLRASPIDGFQPEGAWAAGEALQLQAKGSGHNEGWLLELVF
jgi:hypothetical protein